jgi:hypothetical protein
MLLLLLLLVVVVVLLLLLCTCCFNFRCINWVMTDYSLQLSLVMFVGCSGMMMLGFLLYHAYLISVGTTLHASIRRKKLLREAVEAEAAGTVQLQGSDSFSRIRVGLQGRTYMVAEDQEDAEGRKDVKSSIATAGRSNYSISCRRSRTKAGSDDQPTVSSVGGNLQSQLLCWHRRQQQQQQQHVNPYDRGFWGNWHEVLRPDAVLQHYRIAVPYKTE